MDLKLDQWATTPPAGYPGSVSPPPAKRIAGWANGEEPPAGFFNHAWDALADTQNELANLISGAGLTRSESNLSQVLAAIQTLIGRAQLKTALTTVRAIHDTGIGAQTLVALARASNGTYAGRSIAVGTAATIQANSGPGTNFVAQTAAAPYAGDFTDITYDPALRLFVAVGKSGEIQTSSGNGTWARHPTAAGHFYKVVSDGLGLCVAVGQVGTIRTSTNGTTWFTPAPGGMPTFSGDSKGLAFGAGMFVLATPSGSVASSPNGYAWTTRIEQSLADANAHVVYDPALGFICAGDSADDVYHSADGITWDQIHDSIPSFASTPNGLIASPYGWLAMSRTADGTSVAARYSATAADQPADFTIDYVTSDQLTWMKFIDGQLWALGGTKIYLGGVL